ncbi:MAG: complex I NDUFA9 subunit family protein, partial [Burkholderiaceae bacterium]
MKKILVLGGTGFVGRHVCEKLTRLSYCVTVPTRRRENAKLVQHLPRLDVLEANIHDPATLARLVAGHDAVINLVAILHGDDAAFERTHVALPTALARACTQTEVKRVVHVSALGAALDAPSMYQRSKARGEAALQVAGLDLTLLRPSVIFGADDKFLNMFAALQKVFPVMPLAGSATRFQPVWVEDVAQAIVNSVSHPVQTVPALAEACGPDVFTLKELVQLAARCSGINRGQGRPVLALPMALGRVQAAVMRLLPGEPMLSRDNLDSMQVDNVASGKLPGLTALHVTPTALAAIAPLYLGKQSTAAHLLALR